jgi:hypothetical protein
VRLDSPEGASAYKRSTDILSDAFFDTGRLVTFTPDATLGAVARTLVAGLATLAALMLLSLAGIAWRIRHKGSFRPAISAPLRSIHPLLVGLGG